MAEPVVTALQRATPLRLVALERLNHLRSGAATDRDAADFIAWRNASRAHEHALRDALRLQRWVRILAARTPSETARSNVVPIGLRCAV